MNTVDRLTLVIGPVTESDFFENYWEQQPLHVSRSSMTHFSSLLSIQAIESILSTQTLSFPSIQLTQLGQTIDVSEYTDESRRILPQRLIEKHHEGATIVISKAHESISNLADFRRELQSELQLRCQTNVYLSPQGQQGFNAHFDSHDVFILQVAGTKTFNFYEGGIELPYQHDGFNANEHTIGALTQSIELEPGDTLYIPRGVVHDAVATDKTSLHITLGVYAITQRDVLLEMSEILSNDDIKFRQSVPRETLSKLRNNDELERDKLLHGLTPNFTVELLKSALSNIEDATAIDTAPSSIGLLNSSPNDLIEFTNYRFNLSNLVSVERTKTHIRLRTHGQILEFTQPLISAIEQLLNGGKLDVSKLTDLDDDQIQMLCTRLYYANLLIIENS